MKKIRFCTIIMLSVLVVSCKKNEGTTPAPITVSYLDITNGNAWNYQQTNNPSTSPTVINYTAISSATDTTINTRLYHIFNRSTGGGKEYYYVNGNNYYEYLSLPLLGDFKFENLFLKSDAAVGDTWSQVIPPITYTNFITVTANLVKNDTIKEKGITKIVKGITYTDVVHVSSGLSITSINPAIVPLNTITFKTVIDNYYAPKVGKIYFTNDIKLVVPSFIDQTIENKTELVSTNF